MGVPEKERADVGMGVSVGGSGEYLGRGMDVNVAVGTAICVSASSVPTRTRAVSMTCVCCVLGVDRKLLQEASNTETRRNEVGTLLAFFIFLISFHVFRPNAQRFALPAWGGRVDSPSKRIPPKLGKCSKNAVHTPSRVHALLGAVLRS